MLRPPMSRADREHIKLVLDQIARYQVRHRAKLKGNKLYTRIPVPKLEEE